MDVTPDSIDPLSDPLLDADLGVNGIQLYVIQGESAPENMSKTDHEDFKNFVSSHGLEISALCGDLGEDLDVEIIKTHIGRLPGDENAPECNPGPEPASEVSAYTESHGRILGSETGPEPPVRLKRFLDRVGNPAMKVNRKGEACTHDRSGGAERAQRSCSYRSLVV